MISLPFYQRDDVVQIAKELLGKELFTNIDGHICSGIITETEGYGGVMDKACHAYGNRRTQRTAVMYENGGVSYVYFCYGMHYLLNVVTNQKEIPQAVLIRAIKPILGIDIMLKRRKKKSLSKDLTAGPATVCQALGINLSHNNLSLTGNTIWIEKTKINIVKRDIIQTVRVGVDYAQEDALRPWRFLIKEYQ